MLGNVFSPYYARDRAHRPTNPFDFCTINVAHYGIQSTQWALTERTRRDLWRAEDFLRIGASSVMWDHDGLAVHLRERTSPFGRDLRGVVRIRSDAWRSETFMLDVPRRHRWTPLALHARATVELERPFQERWSGRAYVDTNAGDEPLERGFRFWDWSRTSGPGATHVVYDCERRDGTRSSIRKTFFPDGRSENLSGIEPGALPRTTWGVSRQVPSDAGTQPSVVRSLEDTPFYARTLAGATMRGQPVQLVHETVHMDRFEQGWVQFLIPFRMRRVA